MYIHTHLQLSPVSGLSLIFKVSGEFQKIAGVSSCSSEVNMLVFFKVAGEILEMTRGKSQPLALNDSLAVSIEKRKWWPEKVCILRLMLRLNMVLILYTFVFVMTFFRWKAILLSSWGVWANLYWTLKSTKAQVDTYWRETLCLWDLWKNV